MSDHSALIEKCKSGIRREIKRKRYDRALQLIDTAANLHYHLNTCYMDEALEDSLKQIAQQTVSLHQETYRDDTLLFYDGVGLNQRGLIQIYLKALTKIRKVVYVYAAEVENEIPDIKRILSGHEIVYLRSRSAVKRIEALARLIEQYCPASFFLYAFPFDVVGTVVLNAYKGKRYQINMTDHAFWLGAKAIDTCIEFRDLGANVSRQYRGIHDPVKIPYYPVVDQEMEFQGFPFEPGGRPVVFSGGSLYKTFNPERTYYKIVSRMLDRHPDILFWYAGIDGDRSELERLIARYPGRVFNTDERPDLFQLLQHCLFYLNTYPMCGGLMTQYAAAAGVIPLTLEFEHITEGLLLDQEALGVEFRSPDALNAEMDRIIEDEAYRREKGERLKRAVISPETFDQALAQLLNENTTPFPIDFKETDTRGFLTFYEKNLSEDKLDELIAKRRNPTALLYFPRRYLRGAARKTIRKLRKYF